MYSTREPFVHFLISTALSALALASSSTGQTVSEIINTAGTRELENELLLPHSIEMIEPGCIYVTGFLSNNAFKVGPGTDIEEIVDSSGVTGVAGQSLEAATGIAVDRLGNVYVAGFLSDNVLKLSPPFPGGAKVQIIDATGDGNGRVLNGAYGLAVDDDGNVYVTGAQSHNAFMITPGGAISEIINVDGESNGSNLAQPRGIAVDSSGIVYVAGSQSDNAFMITPSGVITEILSRNMGMQSSSGIAVDKEGNVFVSGAQSDNVMKVSPAGVITEIIGPGDGLNNAVDVDVDATGNVYVAGAESSNAFRITPGGVITELIDSTGTGAGQMLLNTAGITVDSVGRAYVAGTASNNALRISGLAYYSTVNVSPNPESYTADLPIIGGDILLSVDLTTTGHQLASVFSFSDAGFLSRGSSGFILIGGVQVFPPTAPAPGPIARFTLTVPPDPSIVGIALFTQAVHFSGVSPIALSNSIVLTAGF